MDGGVGGGDAAGAAAVGGADGRGGAACCEASEFRASSQVLPHVACPAWQLIDSAEPEEPGFVASGLRLSTSTNAENLYYAVASDNLSVPSTLVIEARVKLISGSSSTASRAPASFGFSYGGTHQKNLLQIANGSIFLLSSENVAGASASVATTDDFHVYRLEVDTETGSIEVFYDGGSKLKFAEALRAAGATCAHTFVIFYYGVFPEVPATLARHGLALHALATWRDVLAEARAGAHFDSETLAEVEAFLAAPVAWSAAHGGADTIAD